MWKASTVKTKILTAILTLAILATTIGAAKAQITVSIEAKDPGNNSVVGLTIPINTIVTVYGHYEDVTGNANASATIMAYYDNGSGLQYMATLFNGTVRDGETVIGTPYVVGQIGYYEFRWTCQKITQTSSEGCNEETAQARAGTNTTIDFKVPEPQPIIGLMAGLAAFGILLAKRKRTKSPTRI